ncbi:hypothetical protein J3R30DRAFT_3523743 [Lentinula aciculospora]|uniref:DNA replication checkpoint mediator MRC1 domain-containing protein n=1 Tax=Lentinula aciculospora TaxID=153920 RepID=A0A9W9A2G4_9AGAR|nr:hypothetical protein J3R30DRAFT_3523743 [Lentinula aciculospora]
MSSSSPQTHKQPARTYGRPKPAIDISASTPSRLIASSTSSNNSLSNGDSDALGEVPPPSETWNSSPVEVQRNDGEGSKNASPKFQWSWKARMKQMDEIEDDEESGAREKAVLLGKSMDEGSMPTDPGPLFLGQREIDILHPITSPSRTTEPSLSQDPFSGSLATLTPSSQGLSQKTLASPSPSPTLSRKRVSESNRVKHKRVLESDAESEQECGKSSCPSSPVKQPINTPQSRSSTTPSTSDSEHQMLRKVKSSSKGKSAAVANPLVLEPIVDRDVPKAKGKRSRSNKVKAPTKKERRDTALDRQRINEQKQVSIARERHKSKLTFHNLLSKLAGNTFSKSVPLKGEDSMDPISEFSSPSGNNIALVASESEGTETKAPRHIVPDVPNAADTDNGAFPGMEQLFKEQRAKSLKEKKLQVIRQQEQSRSFAPLSDDDDDLEIVDGPSTSMQVAIKKEAEARRSGRPSITASTRILQKHAGISVSRRISEVTAASQARNSKELNEVLLKRVKAENSRRTKEKSEEWVRRGGKPLESGVQVSERRGLDWYATRALEESNRSTAEMQDSHDGEEEDEDNEDWFHSLRGSASPAPVEPEGNENDNEEGFEDDQDITMVNEDAEDEDIPTQVDLPHRRSLRAIVVSDTEEEENDENPHLRRQSLGRVLVEDSIILDQDSDKFSPVLQLAHRHSDSPYDGGATEDEGDKENNDRLMYDRSEDKENTAVVRHELLNSRLSLGRQNTLFNLEEGLSSRLSVSSDGYATDENPRGPLKTLSVAEIDPFTPAVIPFVTRLQRTISTATIADDPPDALSVLSPKVSLEPQVSGFSQFSDDGEEFQPKKLEAGFSGFFDSDSQRPSTSSRPPLGSLKEPVQTNNFFAKLRRSDSLALTQDIGLQPALEVDESLVRQADKVFEREQELLLEAVNESTSKKPELYINDQGFITQTRPHENAEIYRPPPTPSQLFSQTEQFAIQGGLSQSSARQPFRDISMSEADFAEDTPVQTGRLHRLRKRDETPSPSSPTFSTMFGGSSTLPPLLSPSEPTKRQRVEPKVRKIRQKLGKSEFVEAEAQESDEDEMFGFRRVEEDEEDGEHLDRTLETLVDDKEMDQTQMAEDKVMEKYQEQRQADDAHDEEVAHKVIDGHFRNGKRRRHRADVDNSDDDDEEEDERGRRIRRKMKEPELRGDIKSLAGQDATRAFAELYQAAIKSDGDPELAFLQGDESNDIIMTGTSYEQDGDADENDENTVNTSDLMRQLREAAQAGEDDGPHLDPNDVSFVDADNEDEDEDFPRVRHVTNANSRSRGDRRTAIDSLEFESAENHKSELMINERGRKQAEAYVKSENRLRKTGTSRSGVGGISVVGSRARKTDSRARDDPIVSKKPQPVKATPSMLKGLTRRDHFQ